MDLYQIPRPDTVPQRKSSILHPSAHSKLSPQPHIHHEHPDESLSMPQPQWAYYNWRDRTEWWRGTKYINKKPPKIIMSCACIKEGTPLLILNGFLILIQVNPIYLFGKTFWINLKKNLVQWPSQQTSRTNISSILFPFWWSEYYSLFSSQFLSASYNSSSLINCDTH
jgi:hypothetical protein